MTASNKPDIEALMAEIRADIKKTARSLPDIVPPYVSKSKLANESPLLHREELNYVNKHWGDWVKITEPSSHRKLLGKFLVRAKRFVFDTVWHVVLKDYLENEKRFQSNLVKHLNNTANYIDNRIAGSFGQLCEKVDNDIKGLNSRVDKLHFLAEGEAAKKDQAFLETLSDLKNRITRLESQIVSLQKDGQGVAGVTPVPVEDSLPPSWKNALNELNQSISSYNQNLNPSE